MRTSQQGVSLIKRFEGLRLEAYRCPRGVLTIGYGHTKDVTDGEQITEEQAEELLRVDLRHAERFVSFYCINLKQQQFDALVSFVYNVGSGNFKGSTLLKKVKADPDDPTIRNEFEKWVKAGGEVLPGLVTRRKEEADLYFSQ